MTDFLAGGDLNKFVVIKQEDAANYLSSIQRGVIGFALGSVEKGRKEEGKKTDNQYLVINVDEPYAPEIVEILKRNGHWG